jgi:hypothetical protein
MTRQMHLGLVSAGHWRSSSRSDYLHDDPSAPQPFIVRFELMTMLAALAIALAATVP